MDSSPQPLCTFAIPSVYDGTRIDCRLHHPRHLSRADTALSWKSKGAIVAHPYAPIGGNYDNLVVCGVAEELLKAGFVVITFNFRGAAESEGRTSWSAKPELGDYVSVYGFLIYYLLGIDPVCVHDAVTEANNRTPSVPDDIPQPATAGSERMEIILAGYSYGSMIASHLPSIGSVLGLFASPAKESPAAEILQLAEQLSALWNLGRKSELSSHAWDSRSTSDSSHRKTSSQFVSMGCSSESSRKRSSSNLDRAAVLKQRVERSQRRLRARFMSGHTQENQAASAAATVTANELAHSMLTPAVSFLLISPVLPPISNFMTLSLFGSRINLDVTLQGMRIRSTQPEEQLTAHRTLAVYGDNDMFASVKRLRKWFTDLAQMPASMFEFREIETAGHFWFEPGTEALMRTAVREWAGRGESGLSSAL